MNAIVDPKKRNELIFKELIKALSSDDEQTFLKGAAKITLWVSRPRAYYTEMKPTILRALEAARATLTRLCKCSTDFTATMDIPAEFLARKEAYVKLVGTVVLFVKHFYCGEEAHSLGPRIDALFRSVKGSNEWVESTAAQGAPETSVSAASRLARVSLGESEIDATPSLVSNDGAQQSQVVAGQMSLVDARGNYGRAQNGQQLVDLTGEHDLVGSQTPESAYTSIAPDVVQLEAPAIDSNTSQDISIRDRDLIHQDSRIDRSINEGSNTSVSIPTNHDAPHEAKPATSEAESLRQVQSVSVWALANNQHKLNNSHPMNPLIANAISLPLTAHSLSLHDASQRNSTPAQLAAVKRNAPSSRSSSPATIPTPISELRARRTSLTQGYTMHSRQLSPSGLTGLSSTSPAVPSPLSAAARPLAAPTPQPTTVPGTPQYSQNQNHALPSGPSGPVVAGHVRKFSGSSSVSEGPDVPNSRNDSQLAKTDSRPRKRPKFSLPRKVSGSSANAVENIQVEVKDQLASWERADLEWYSSRRLSAEADKEQPFVQSPGVSKEQEGQSSDIRDCSTGPAIVQSSSIGDEEQVVKSDVLQSKFTPSSTKLLAIRSGVPVGNQFAINFEIPEVFAHNPTNWKNRFEANCDVSNSMCLSLACYSGVEQSSTDPEDLKMELLQRKPSWPQNSSLYAQIEKSKIYLAPPLNMSDDNFVDVTRFVHKTGNIVFNHYADMSQYTFVVYAHPPTPSQIREYQERRDADTNWNNFLKDFSRPFSIID